MSLTATQKAEIRRFMGYSDLTQGYYSTLEGALNALSAEAELQVATILTDLAAIEAQLRTSWSRQKVKRAEDVELAGHDELVALYREGNRLAGLLGTVTGVPVAQAPFGGGSNAGLAGRG